jgi:cytochrome c oxidase cbb3-type subunit 3
MRGIALAGFFFAAPALTFAQETAPGTVTPSQAMWTLLIALIILAIVAVFFAITMLAMVRKEIAEKAAAAGQPIEMPSMWKSFMKSMTKAVPVENEATVDMGHSYDGIRELDNSLPPWWVYGFYVTIIFSVGYLWYFHTGTPGRGQADEYKSEMAEAQVAKEAFLKKAGNAIDEKTVTLITDAGRISAGKATFAANCAVCHGAAGEGKVGPNLTDVNWIHGGTINDLFKTIKYGVPAKGMVPWEASLTPVQIQDVASFILSLQGTNPAGAKAPEGEPMQAAGAPADTTAKAK